MTKDPSTLSNYDFISVKHMTLKWKIDFEKEIISGEALLRAKVLKAAAELVLDCRGLDIASVAVSGREATFKIEKGAAFGDKLVIAVGDRQASSEFDVVVTYNTSVGASALQFLNKEQTTDRIAPFLFSQCQAIHARSIVPCQDTPSVKSTYEAEVTVPRGFTCLMSAVQAGAPKDDGEYRVFKFTQSVPIPSYLLAIVVGFLEKRDISARCAVWAEKSVVDKARDEFQDTEVLLNTAEEIAGPYVWGRYDLLILPATFPFGGMENPCLTFVTPTLLAGDRSLVNVIAHEIAHSWTGNLVTNSSWEHFWLNEGFTVFLERQILGRLHGESFRDFEFQIGYENTLTQQMNVFGPEHEFTKLIPTLTNVDPDDCFSCVPYEKGSSLLLYLEQTLGNKAKFEVFLRGYITTHAYSSITTDVWKEDLYRFFASQKEVLEKIDWNTWLYKPGMPPKPRYGGELMKECEDLTRQWVESDGPTSAESYFGLKPLQKIAVLQKLFKAAPLAEAKMEKITSLYKLNETQNAEIRFGWLHLGLASRWLPIVTPALAFALNVGRMKFLRPIYRELFQWPETRARAVAQFQENRRFMHPISAHVVEKLLNLPSSSS